MTGLRDELVRAHDARTHELWDLVEALGNADRERAGYQEDWSVKDLVSHLAAWHARGCADLEQIRGGTYAGRPKESAEERLARLERENREYHEAWAGEAWDAVHAEWSAGRTRLLQAFDATGNGSDDAAARFRRVAIEHYDDHLPRLREWVRELRP